eukprot:8694712-Lingulodinium_polyedra.AAC.1
MELDDDDRAMASAAAAAHAGAALAAANASKQKRTHCAKGGPHRRLRQKLRAAIMALRQASKRAV